MCVLPPGGGRSLPVTVSIGGQHLLSSSATFDYESPVVSSVTPSVGPSYGGSVLTVTGSGFGTSADGATVFVGDEPCEASSWISDTQILCVSPRTELATGSAGDDVDSSGVDGLSVTVRVFNQSSRSSATFVSSAEDISPTEYNPGFGHPPNRKRGPFYVSVAYILAIALAVAVLLLGRHLMKRPAPSSLLSSYTGVRTLQSAPPFTARYPFLSSASDLCTSGVAGGERGWLSSSGAQRVELSGLTPALAVATVTQLTRCSSLRWELGCFTVRGRQRKRSSAAPWAVHSHRAMGGSLLFLQPTRTSTSTARRRRRSRCSGAQIGASRASAHAHVK